MEVWVCHQIFTAYTQWPCCSAPGSLWKMPDSNPGPLAPQLGALTISHHKPPPPHFTAEICFNKIHQCYINVSEKPCSVGPISFCFRTCVSAITPGIILKRLGGGGASLPLSFVVPQKVLSYIYNICVYRRQQLRTNLILFLLFTMKSNLLWKPSLITI